MKIALTVLTLLFFLPVISQEMGSYIISVAEVTSVKEEYKKVELLRDKNENVIIFKDLKKERLALNEKDSLRLIALLERKDKKYHDELFSLIEKTKQYKVDTVHVKNDNHIFKVTDSFYESRKKIERDSDENEDKRIILHGTMIYITVVDSQGHSYSYSAQSPTMESHPEIFKLVSALQNAYPK